MHDNTLDRTTNGTGEVGETYLDEVRALDAGARFSPAFAGTKVPTLDEALELAKGKINVYVDTKYADPQQLIDTIVRHDMQDHVVIYGNPFFLYEVHKIRPSLRVMPEALSPDICKFLDRAMQLQVIAFDASDFKDGVIEVAKVAHAQIFVDRLGDADTAEAWQKAIDQELLGSRPIFLRNSQHICATINSQRTDIGISWYCSRTNDQHPETYMSIGASGMTVDRLSAIPGRWPWNREGPVLASGHRN